MFNNYVRDREEFGTFKATLECIKAKNCNNIKYALFILFLCLFSVLTFFLAFYFSFVLILLLCIRFHTWTVTIQFHFFSSFSSFFLWFTIFIDVIIIMHKQLELGLEWGEN